MLYFRKGLQHGIPVAPVTQTVAVYIVFEYQSNFSYEFVQRWGMPRWRLVDLLSAIPGWRSRGVVENTSNGFVLLFLNKKVNQIQLENFTFGFCVKLRKRESYRLSNLLREGIVDRTTNLLIGGCFVYMKTTISKDTYYKDLINTRLLINNIRVIFSSDYYYYYWYIIRFPPLLDLVSWAGFVVELFTKEVNLVGTVTK